MPGAARAWRHPWFTEARWLPGRQAWVAVVVAGFVNGMAPFVRTSSDDLREARGTFFATTVDPRTGQAEILQLAKLAAEDNASSNEQDVPLHESPPIRMDNLRKIGWDGDARVPKFFQDRGVNAPEKGGEQRNPDKGAPRENRLLRACDIILYQPRAALTSRIEINLSGAVGGAWLVNQTLGTRMPPPEDRLRIQSGNFNAAEESKLDFGGVTQLQGDYEEKTWDRLKISTVYLLSPWNAPWGSSPDATWQPFVQHDLFWNLHWDQPALRDLVFPNDIFRPVLGAMQVLGVGAGFFLASSITASINDATQQAYNVLTATSLAGSFWSPTGSGTTSALPSKPAAVSKTGVDKVAQYAAKAQAAVAAKRLRKLDPAFPYEGLKFNRSLLS